MRPQLFRSRTLAGARRAALDALGQDAVLLTTRKVARAGFTGLFGASDVEIAAVVQAQPPEPPPAGSPRGPGPFAEGVYQADGDKTPSEGVSALRAELRHEMRAIRTTLTTAQEPKQDVAGELAALRALVESLSANQKPAARVASRVRAMGVEGPAATALTQALQGKSDADAVRDAVSTLVKATSWPLARSERSTVAVVGPTGVGKTTTVAKLAARARMDGRSVHMIACDTFRVGAVEQLQRYASLIGADFSTARTAAELLRAASESTADVVLVDTSGRLPTKDGVEMALAKKPASSTAPGARARHVLLCVPAALRASDAARIAKAFAKLSPSALAITKIDETLAPSGLVHAPVAAKLAVGVLCFGQRVPEDVAPATSGAILDYLCPRSVTT